MGIKSELLERLSCPQCGSHPLEITGSQLHCTMGGHCYPLENGIPVFTPPPPGLIPSEKIPRGPQVGTPWRQANWRFLSSQVDRLAGEAVLLDVGAGRGDFSDVFHQRPTIALDVYPYPEVDVVCDLAEANPFQPASFDGVVLMNVLEHVYDSHALLDALSQLLKPGGVLLVAVPFMVKIHQAPVDFARYTHYALERLGQDHGLAVESLEGYYDPVFFLGEGLGNLRWAVLPGIKGRKRFLARLLLAGMQTLAGGLGAILGKGSVIQPEKARSFAPTGYQVVYRKKE